MLVYINGRGVRTADADIRGPGSADFLANGPRIRQTNTHLRVPTICGSKATSIVCRTNFERKCQCTSSQQFENWSILVNAYGPPTSVVITIANANHPQTWCLRTRIIRGCEICRSAHLWLIVVVVVFLFTLKFYVNNAIPNKMLPTILHRQKGRRGVKSSSYRYIYLINHMFDMSSY